MKNEIIVLGQWEKAKRAIAECTTLDEVKVIRDKAQALKAYAKQAKESLEVQNNVAEIKIRCERKMGQITLEMPTEHGKRTDRTSRHDDEKSQKTKKEALEEAGIDSTNASRNEAMAGMDEKDFEEEIETAKKNKEELTTARVVRKAKSKKKKEKNERLKLFGVQDLPKGKYATLVIDPPWPMEKIDRDVRPNQSKDAFEYPTMSEKELLAFDVPSFSADDAHLYLWVTHKYLPMGLRLAEHWGFKYQCLMTWVKNFGFTPFSWMYSTEHVIFATKGSLPLLELGIRLDFNAKVREHSRKPDEFYEIVKRASPGPRIDVFSREKRDGFDQFGNEVNKF
jgi:N6-adenosine-specific RNA methylase IME4